jgi:hypothetical protein
LNEGEIEEVKWKIIQPRKKATKGQTLEQSLPIPQTSNSQKQKILMKDFKLNDKDPDGELASKKARLGLNSTAQTHRTLLPLGL